MAPLSSPSPPDEPIEIFLAEDDPGDVGLVKEAFDSIDRETNVRGISNGDDAVAALLGPDAEPPYPDLVVLDLNLPGRDGCEVLREIRDDPSLGGLPVIVLSSSRSEADIVRCYKAKANAYLTKPSDPDGFVSLIRTVERFWFETARLPPVPA